MKYLCLIYDEERTFGAMSKTEIDALMKEYRAFSDGIRQSGHYIAGHQLAPVRSASTVRVRNGKMSATDGPFAETKEQLGGRRCRLRRAFRPRASAASRCGRCTSRISRPPPRRRT